MQEANISSLEVEELACKLVGLDYDEIDADTEVIEEALYNHFETDLENLTSILRKLLPMIDVGASPLTGKTFKGFADKERGMWLLKAEV